ncbi:MAG: class I SAM-dependent methyltransferase, partial [Chloroflexi bacterium]|nr:class I SAM-dependent methyltransferase [Chloroflexota bacterium]
MMTTNTIAQVDWADWMRRWDAQQTYYVPGREARFNAMLDVLEALLPAEFVALDLACGPGSISQRLLARFPAAQAIALDLDPVLLALGQDVLGTAEGRLRWVDASLLDDAWPASLGVEQVDAVLSTTALHWLPAANLVRMYQHLGALIRPGGVFLNGDHLAYPPHQPTMQQAASAVKERRQAAAQARGQ